MSVNIYIPTTATGFVTRDQLSRYVTNNTLINGLAGKLNTSGNVLLTAGTGSFGNVVSTSLSCGTGSFGNVVSTSLSCGTGSFGNVVSTSLTAGTGSFGKLVSTSLTSGTGSFSNVSSTNLTCGTGAFTNLSISGNITAPSLGYREYIHTVGQAVTTGSFQYITFATQVTSTFPLSVLTNSGFQNSIFTNVTSSTLYLLINTSVGVLPNADNAVTRLSLDIQVNGAAKNYFLNTRTVASINGQYETIVTGGVIALPAGQYFQVRLNITTGTSAATLQSGTNSSNLNMLTVKQLL